MSRRIPIRLIAALVAALLLLPLTACSSDQTAEANTAITAADAQVAKYTAAGADLGSLMTEARSLGMTSSADASRGVELTDRMTASLDAQAAAAAAASGELAKVGRLRVSAGLKTYAAKELAVVSAAAKESASARSLVADMRALYQMVGSGTATPAAVAQTTARIDDGSSRLGVMDAEVTRLEKDATAYYDQQGLGGR